MGRLQDLADRFDRARRREVSSLSGDAVEIVREQVEDIKKALISEDFGKESTKAAALVAEVVGFQQKIPSIKLVVEKTEEAPKKDEKPIVYEAVGRRASSADETVSVLRRYYTGTTTDIREATRLAREAYREALKVEGPLERHELDGISRFISEVVKTRAPRGDATIRATFIHNGITESKMYSSEAALREGLQGLKEVTIVEIDKSAEIYEEAARKFQPLLENQTVRSVNAVNEVARVRAAQSALSAKVAASLQVIEALVARTNRAEKALAEARKDLDSSVRLVEALATESEIERMRGGVLAIAGTHPHLDGLSETLSRANNLQEAIARTNKLSLDSLPDVNREPLGDRTKRISEAIDRSAEAQMRADQQVAGETFGDTKMRGIAEVTDGVLKLMRDRGIGR